MVGWALQSSGYGDNTLELHRILDTIHVVVCIYMMYWYLITNYGKTSELVVVHWTFGVRSPSIFIPHTAE